MYTRRAWLTALAAMALAAAIVYAASLYAPLSPQHSQPNTTIVVVSPAFSTTRSTSATSSIQPKTGGAGISMGVVAPSVKRLLSRLSEWSTGYIIGRGVTVTVATPTVTPLRGIAGIENRAASPAYTETGTLVAVPGVDELDTVKLVNGILYVVRGGLVYRVNLTAAKPLEPLNPLAEARRTWGTAKLYIELPQGATVERVIHASIALRGILYTGGAIAALVTVSYSYPGLWASSDWTGVIAYNGSKPTCKMLLPGRLVDARGSNGLLWIETLTGWRIYRIMGGRASGKPGVLVAVVNTTSCKASMIKLNATSTRAPLLLVEPGARTAYLAASAWTPKKGWVTLVARLVYNGTLYATDATLLPGLLPSNWLSAISANDTLILILERQGGGFTLYTLDPESLRVVAKLDVPRLREKVHAILYLRGTLYIVTYRAIDPLFAINLTDLKHPRLVGWREGPGYDQILWPLRDNIIIGIGYSDRHTLRISTYKMLENASLEPIDRLTLPGYTAPLLSRPDAYRYLAISSSVVAYPVFTCKGPCRQEVLAARVSAGGRIEAYRLLEGYRAVYWNDKLYVITNDKVLIVSTKTLKTLEEVKLPISK